MVKPIEVRTEGEIPIGKAKISCDTCSWNVSVKVPNISNNPDNLEKYKAGIEFLLGLFRVHNKKIHRGKAESRTNF